MNVSEFFAMGGYAEYVWSSWLLTLLVLAWNVLAPQRKHQKLLEQLEVQTKREQLKNSTHKT
ncbi:MAG TPA: heme exporter protein CcmD [Gammaproteobacteria bacterium]|jgi:heme exporter protein D|nr:heme exporter protein CcmD [Gammaproteobacteria bacterium]